MMKNNHGMENLGHGERALIFLCFFFFFFFSWLIDADRSVHKYTRLWFSCRLSLCWERNTDVCESVAACRMVLVFSAVRPTFCRWQTASAQDVSLVGSAFQTKTSIRRDRATKRSKCIWRRAMSAKVVPASAFYVELYDEIVHVHHIIHFKVA